MYKPKKAFLSASLNPAVLSLSLLLWAFLCFGEYRWEVRNPLLFSVCFGNGRFVTVGDSGCILMNIPDGGKEIWTKCSSGTSVLLNCVSYSQDWNTFVAVGNSGVIMASSDGINWTRQYSGTNRNLLTVSYDKGMFLAAGSDATVLVCSDISTGVAWRQTHDTDFSRKQNKLVAQSNPSICEYGKITLYTLSGRKVLAVFRFSSRRRVLIDHGNMSSGSYMMMSGDKQASASLNLDYRQ
ncbi:MAG TPA: hypothetical protein VHP36_02850 [Chitinispirillaceae bacterium]|nr:hypothetical protein [Chitinispirillaceae bacterium]